MANDTDGPCQSRLVTPTVYNAFVSGPYASWVVNDVTMVEFPKWQAIIVIEVGQDNVDIKYQLFYSLKECC